MFGSSLFYLFITCGKKSIQFYKETRGKYWGASENYSFVEASYVYVMVAQKNITRGPLMAPVIANAKLYWSGSILFENHGLDSSL